MFWASPLPNSLSATMISCRQATCYEHTAGQLTGRAYSSILHNLKHCSQSQILQGVPSVRAKVFCCESASMGILLGS